MVAVCPAHELFNESGYSGPQPSILPCCHVVHALRGPFSFGWDLKFCQCFAVGKGSFLWFVVLSTANGPNLDDHFLNHPFSGIKVAFAGGLVPQGRTDHNQSRLLYLIFKIIVD